MSYWAIVHTQSRHEDMVCVQLKRAEFEIYLPRIKLDSRIEPTPLFPGYLFVRIVDRWYPVRWTRGVIGLLPIPTQLQEKTMNEIRNREGRDGLVKLPANQLRKGQQVRITRGNFEGQIALCEGMSGKDRVRVLLNMLGQKVPVELSGHDLEPLSVAAQ
jgi:transcription antitermination factor NusG